MKAQDARGEAYGRDAPFLREAADGRFANLQECGKLSRRQEFFARKWLR